jgi:hypothetical protein
MIGGEFEAKTCQIKEKSNNQHVLHVLDVFIDNKKEYDSENHGS